MQVMDQLPAHQAILSNCFYIDLAPHEDPLELQTQASKITGALATLFSAIGRAYMGEIAAGALIDLCNHTTEALSALQALP